MNKLKKKMSTIAAIAAASTIALSMMGTSASAASNGSFTEISASYTAGSIAYGNTSVDAWGNLVVTITTKDGHTDTYVNGTQQTPVTAQSVSALEADIVSKQPCGYSQNTVSYTRNGDTGAIYTEVTTVDGRTNTYKNGEFFCDGSVSRYDGNITYCTDIVNAQSAGAQITEAQAREGALRGQAAMSAEAARTQATQTATQTTSTPASNKNTTQTANTPVTTRTATAGGILVVTTTKDSRGRVISTTSHMEQPVGTAEIRAVQKEKNKAVASSNASSSSSASSNRNTSTSTSSSTSNRNTSTSSSSAPSSAVQQKVAEQAAAGAARGAAAMAQYANSTSSKNYNAAQQAAQQKAAEQAAAGAARGAAAMAQYANKK